MFSNRGHQCHTVREAGFEGIENGELLTLAESDFDVLVTVDKNIRYQKYARTEYCHFSYPNPIQ